MQDLRPGLVITGGRSSAGTGLVIHKDGGLLIGTAPLAVPLLGLPLVADDSELAG